jgi:hypothetical protein
MDSFRFDQNLHGIGMLYDLCHNEMLAGEPACQSEAYNLIK